jgi:hypothetical protein
MLRLYTSPVTVFNTARNEAEALIISLFNTVAIMRLLYMLHLRLLSLFRCLNQVEMSFCKPKSIVMQATCEGYSAVFVRNVYLITIIYNSLCL